MYHLEVGDLSPESSLLRQIVSSICARSSFPLDIVFQFLLYEPNPFQHVGDVIYSSFLHLQQYIIRQICPETTAAVLEKGRVELTASASAALFRSSTPSGAASTKLTNFFVKRPRELSYRQLPASLEGTVKL